MKNNLLQNMLVAIAALFIASFALPAQAEVEEYYIMIAGHKLTSEDNLDDIEYEGKDDYGKMSYNPATRTLTIMNSYIDVINPAIYFYDEDKSHEYTLVMIGFENKLCSHNDNTALITNSNLTIKGGGRAYISSYDGCGILVRNGATLTITDGCFINTSGRCGIKGDTGTETLIIDNANIKAKVNRKEYSKGTISGFKNIQLNNCKIKSPTDATIEGGNVMQNGSLCEEEVMILQNEFPISIDNIPITSDENLDDIKRDAIKSGKVSYDPKKLTLTLENAVIETSNDQNYAISISDNKHTGEYSGYYIEMRGDGNKITSKNTALYSRSNLVIIGDKRAYESDGSAEITSTNNYGIYVSPCYVIGITELDNITIKGTSGIASDKGSETIFVIDDATVKVKGNGTEASILNFNEIQLYESVILTAPAGATIEGGNVMLNGEVCKEEVVIQKVDIGLDVKIGGKVLDLLDNLDDIKRDAIKSGKVSYDLDTRTITLENAVIETEDQEPISFLGQSNDHTILLKGNDNKLIANSLVLDLRSNLTIKGNGSLEITSKKSAAILVKKASTLTITGGCSITTSGCIRGDYTDIPKKDMLIIDGANVRAKGKGSFGSIYGFKEIQLNNSVIADPIGAISINGDISRNGYICTEEVVIEKVDPDLDIKIDNREISNDDNLDDINRDAIKSGKVSYNPDTRTITLENAVIETEDYSPIVFGRSNDHTIVLKGNDNKLISKNTVLRIPSNLTIKGDGALEIISKEVFSIFVENASTLTITGGCYITASGEIAGHFQNRPKKDIMIIDGANLRVKYTGKKYSYGSLYGFKDILLNNSVITEPAGAVLVNGDISLNGNICTEEVVIKMIDDGIGVNEIKTESTKRGIYTISGVKINTDFDKLPKGIYIVDGVVKVKK